MQQHVINFGAASPPPATSEPPPESTRDKIVAYVRSVPGILRIVEAVLSFFTIICIAEGYCPHTSGHHGFIMFVAAVTFVEALVLILVFSLRLQDQQKVVNVPLSLLLNDAIKLLFYFIIAILAMIQIGGCYNGKPARIFGALFIIATLLLLVGLCYINYLCWMKAKGKEPEKSPSTTITNSSPTVLT